jgi:hypothetical protein
VPEVFAGSTSAALRRIVSGAAAALGDVFRAVLAADACRARADVVYRGRQIAQSGVGGMLNVPLLPASMYDRGVVTVRLADPLDRMQAIDGNGLTLVPTMFTPPRVRSGRRRTADDHVLRPRAGGAVGGGAPSPIRPPSRAVLGETRASLLAALGIRPRRRSSACASASPPRP